MPVNILCLTDDESWVECSFDLGKSLVSTGIKLALNIIDLSLF